MAATGVCLLSDRDFRPGELVLFENPLFYAACEEWTPGYPGSHTVAMVRKALADPDLAKRLLEKHAAISHPIRYEGVELASLAVRNPGTPVDRLYCILQRTQLSYLAGEGRICVGYYERLACANHSCSPNCELDTTRAKTLVLRARCRIRPGDELTLSYMQFDPFASTRLRREELWNNYGFMCECRLCSEI